MSCVHVCLLIPSLLGATKKCVGMARFAWCFLVNSHKLDFRRHSKWYSVDHFFKLTELVLKTRNYWQIYLNCGLYTMMNGMFYITWNFTILEQLHDRNDI